MDRTRRQQFRAIARGVGSFQHLRHQLKALTRMLGVAQRRSEWWDFDEQGLHWPRSRAEGLDSARARSPGADRRCRRGIGVQRAGPAEPILTLLPESFRRLLNRRPEHAAGDNPCWRSRGIGNRAAVMARRRWRGDWPHRSAQESAATQVRLLWTGPPSLTARCARPRPRPGLGGPRDLRTTQLWCFTVILPMPKISRGSWEVGRRTRPRSMRER